jgi:hypothetical protein
MMELVVRIQQDPERGKIVIIVTDDSDRGTVVVQDRYLVKIAHRNHRE